MIALTLEPPTAGATHRSSRRLAARTGISVTTIQRIWAEAGLKPNRIETFKFSTDPDLVAKVRDVVGLYRAPPERAIVLAFLAQVERAYPEGQLHVVLDNVSSYKTPAIREWLEAHPRVNFHFTPTSASG